MLRDSSDFDMSVVVRLNRGGGHAFRLQPAAAGPAAGGECAGHGGRGGAPQGTVGPLGRTRTRTLIAGAAHNHQKPGWRYGLTLPSDYNGTAGGPGDGMATDSESGAGPECGREAPYQSPGGRSESG